LVGLKKPLLAQSPEALSSQTGKGLRTAWERSETPVAVKDAAAEDAAAEDAVEEAEQKTTTTCVYE
jgi:hypothetical protein